MVIFLMWSSSYLQQTATPTKIQISDEKYNKQKNGFKPFQDDLKPNFRNDILLDLRLLESACAEESCRIRICATEAAVEVHRLIAASHFENIATE